MYDRISNIYNRMQDDASKYIFKKRLEYSLSGDKKEIEDIVLSEINRYRQDDVIYNCINWIKEQNSESVIVFGAGFAGAQVVHTLGLYNISVLEIFDNNKDLYGKKIDNINICAPRPIEKNKRIILAVNYHREDIVSQLINIGILREQIYIPEKLWWLGRYPQYFDEDIIMPNNREVFIDGGSLDGSDSINFAKWCGKNRYEKIYAFEPDSSNLEKLHNVTEILDDIIICPVGMWNEKTVLKFMSDNKENCMLSDDGNVLVEVDTIDNILAGEYVSYIKMDIEGSELAALEGAKESIVKYKPRLAICVYHKPEDIIDIPLKILELNPNYVFYLRHYSYLETETVLYAIDNTY